MISLVITATVKDLKSKDAGVGCKELISHIQVGEHYSD